MPTQPDAAAYLALFEQYGRAFGAAYLEPDDERYRLLFDQVCQLLRASSTFNQAMPQEFRRTARRYLSGEAETLAHMRTAQMRHFMLSDLYDYVHLAERMGQSDW